MKIIAVLLIAVAAGAWYFVGISVEAKRIQASCDDPNGVTMLGGSPYVCLNGSQWNAIVEQLKGRGA